MARCMTLLIILAFLAALVPGSAPACSLCDPSLRAQNTLRQEADAAKVVLFGNIANPQMLKRPGMPGGGVTEFHVQQVLRDDPARAGQKVLMINAFLPVADPRDPPRCLFFASVNKNGQLNPPYCRFVKSEAVLAYLKKVFDIQGKDRTRQLEFFFTYLDHTDPEVSQDAFHEFAQCSDVEIGNIAKHLPAAKLKALLQNPKTPAQRLGLYAFLLGASGNDKEAATVLKKMIEEPGQRGDDALDGLLCGYIHLQPADGWALTKKIVTDGKKTLSQRLCAVRTMRFYHAWKPAESKKDILTCMAAMIPDGEIADMAIDDLRQWKMWDLTPQILTQFEKPSHNSPLARNGIIKYALCCPLPEAQQFVAAVRQRDPELVKDIEDALDFEKGK